MSSPPPPSKRETLDNFLQFGLGALQSGQKPSVTLTVSHYLSNVRVAAYIPLLVKGVYQNQQEKGFYLWQKIIPIPLFEQNRSELLAEATVWVKQLLSQLQPSTTIYPDSFEVQTDFKQIYLHLPNLTIAFPRSDIKSLIAQLKDSLLEPDKEKDDLDLPTMLY